MSARRRVWSTALMVVAAAALAPPRSFAQSDEVDAGEVSVRGGVAFGGGSSGIGSQPVVAGSTGVALSRHGMVFFDTSFMPLGHHTIQGWPERATVDRSYLLDFGVDFHIRFPVKNRLAPYAIAGTGLMWNMVRQHTADAAGNALVRHYNQFNGALHTGGGLRYYIGENWGIRPEVKVVVSKQVYTCMSVGIFYVVPAMWP